MANGASKKEQLLESFDVARRHNMELIQEISEYVQMNNAGNVLFMSDLSFQSIITTLSEERDVVFNDKNRMAIINAEEEAQDLDFLINKIEAQINYYAEIKMGLNVFFKSIN